MDARWTVPVASTWVQPHVSPLIARALGAWIGDRNQDELVQWLTRARSVYVNSKRFVTLHATVLGINEISIANAVVDLVVANSDLTKAPEALKHVCERVLEAHASMLRDDSTASMFSAHVAEPMHRFVLYGDVARDFSATRAEFSTRTGDVSRALDGGIKSEYVRSKLWDKVRRLTSLEIRAVAAAAKPDAFVFVRECVRTIHIDWSFPEDQRASDLLRLDAAQVDASNPEMRDLRAELNERMDISD